MPGGLVCIVTGASSGIGWQVARLLAGRGESVIGVGRDAKRCFEAAEAIRRLTGNPQVSYLTADLSSQTAIRELFHEIADRFERVDILINNAGMFTFRRAESCDGVEMQFAVNYLAGFLLTGLLMPLLAKAPAARVVTTSSGSHFAGRIHWNDLMLQRSYNGLAAYDQSKLATVLFTQELARRFGSVTRIASYAVDPGLVKTDIGAKGNNRLVRLAWRIRTRHGIPAEQAAGSLVFCAREPEAGGRSGLYWKECISVPPSRAACRPDDARRLWELSEQLCDFSYVEATACRRDRSRTCPGRSRTRP
ncbi:MAG TPA: SDR family NAD(P)-dependent oxidoreductase [Spirochaetia bacterium]|nr:SDR family NAD(P)-dependent oxidoreductase [Spirochaetia bacterium]